MAPAARAVVVAACFVSSAQGATLRSSPPMDAVAQIMQTLPIVGLTDDSSAFKDATEFLEGLKDKSPPTSPSTHVVFDPQSTVGFFACTRDTTSCPSGFEASEGGICTPTDA